MSIHPNLDLSIDVLALMLNQAVTQFNKRHPREKPFIKIIVLRDRRRTESNWRRIEHFSEGKVTDSVEIKEESIFKVRRKIKTKKTYKSKIAKDIVGREYGYDDKEIAREIVSDEFSTKTIDVKDSYPANVEMHDDELPELHEFIHQTHISHIVGNQVISQDVIATNQKLSTFISQKPTGDLNDEELMVKMVQLAKSEQTIQENADYPNKVQEVDTLRREAVKLADKIISLESDNQILIDKMQEIKDQEEKINKLDEDLLVRQVKVESKLKKQFKITSTIVAAEKFVEIQTKLNLLMKSLGKYTSLYDEMVEPSWSAYKEEHGFIAALGRLIEVFYDDICPEQLAADLYDD
jgi:broad-specificity NMP kinase